MVALAKNPSLLEALGAGAGCWHGLKAFMRTIATGQSAHVHVQEFDVPKNLGSVPLHLQHSSRRSTSSKLRCQVVCQQLSIDPSKSEFFRLACNLAVVYIQIDQA